MPFTLAHPAAVVPLARRRLPLSALVVGSMSPDFLYLLHLTPRGAFGHTLPGLFLFCLPAGLAVLWAYHCLVQRPLVRLLPVPVQARVAPHVGGFRFGPLPRLALVVLAVLVGAATHQLWDGFTHRDGWGVALLPELREQVGLPVLGSMQGYRILQHLSTLTGAVLLAVWAGRWYRQAPRAHPGPTLSPTVRAVGLGALVVLPLAFGAYWGWLHGAPVNTSTFLVEFAVHAAVGTLTAGAVGLLGLGVLWWGAERLGLGRVSR